MPVQSTITDRPSRWSVPFGAGMSDQDVQRLTEYPLFAQMSEPDFPSRLPLRGILQNDCRVIACQDGVIIIREGDYGSSAFLILTGSVTVALKSLPTRLLGRPENKKKSWGQILAQLWTNSSVAESRDLRDFKKEQELGNRLDSDGQTRFFLQDIPRILDQDQMADMHEGELFGEMAALTRGMRSATVFSKGNAKLLEIRWQGLRDLMKYSPALKEYTSRQYKEHSLSVHLRETSLFSGLDDSTLEKLAETIEFSSFGNFEWQNKYKAIHQKDAKDQVDSEPLIVKEGQYVSGLILIRNGFARVSRQYGDGHRTESYLGKGGVFGMRELIHNNGNSTPIPWQNSLRAVGYVDVLTLPTKVAEELVLPNLTEDQRDQLSQLRLLDNTENDRISLQHTADEKKETSQDMSERDSIESDRLETLLERRLVNGLQTMLIDLERCTRCDDCVRACADAHDGNPRFLRQGPVIGHHLVAHACMHCNDPVCMIGCPTGAIGRDNLAGTVNINDKTCIGCGTCSVSCPYQNIRMVEVFDQNQRRLVDEAQLPILKATKCDLCADQHGGPACQHACPHDALVRMDMQQIDVLSQWMDRC